MTDFHLAMLARARDRHSDALAAYESFAANMDWSNTLDVGRLETLRMTARHAEIAVRSAEKALEGFEAMQRAVALGM